METSLTRGGHSINGRISLKSLPGEGIWYGQSNNRGSWRILAIRFLHNSTFRSSSETINPEKLPASPFTNTERDIFMLQLGGHFDFA